LPRRDSRQLGQVGPPDGAGSAGLSRARVGCAPCWRWYPCTRPLCRQAGGGHARAGDRGLDCGEDIELPVEARDAQDLGHRRRRRGQAQEPAEQPGAAPGAHQYGEAGGVGVGHAGQVDDEPAGAGAEQAEELLTQGWSAGNVELAAERGDDAGALRPLAVRRSSRHRFHICSRQARDLTRRLA